MSHAQCLISLCQASTNYNVIIGQHVLSDIKAGGLFSNFLLEKHLKRSDMSAGVKYCCLPFLLLISETLFFHSTQSYDSYIMSCLSTSFIIQNEQKSSYII